MKALHQICKLQLQLFLALFRRSGQMIVLKVNLKHQRLLDILLHIGVNDRIGTTLITAFIAGAEIVLNDTPTITFDLLMLQSPVALTSAQAVCIGLLLPLLTLVTINQVQMTLSLYVKPILSFLICIGLLVIAVYASSPFAVGNGAMVIRSGYLLESGIDPGIACGVCIVTYLACMLLGTIRFRHTDILGIEE